MMGARTEVAGALADAIRRADKEQTALEMDRFAEVKDKPFSKMFDSGADEQVAGLRESVQGWMGAANECEHLRSLSAFIESARATPEFEMALPALVAQLEEERQSLARAMEAGLSQVNILEGRQSYAEAEKVLLGLLERCPTDERLVAMQPALSEKARLERSARSEQMYRAGRVAYAYVLSRIDPQMSEADRLWSRDAHAEEIEPLTERLQLTVVVEPGDEIARRLVPLMVGSDRNVEVSAVPPLEERAYTFIARLSETALAIFEPTEIRVEPGSAQYVSGTQWVANPEKQRCRQEVFDLSQQVSQGQSDLYSAQQEHQSCMQQVQVCKNQANQLGGWGGVGASIACGVGEGVCNGAYNNAQTAFQNIKNEHFQAQSRCNAVAEQVEENVYSTKNYSIHVWGVTPSGRCRVKIVEQPPEGQAPQQPVFALDSLSHSFSVEDPVVEGQPEYNVPANPLELPNPEQLEQRLLEEMGQKARSLVVERLQDYWKRLFERASVAPGEPARRELLSQIVILQELSGNTGEELVAKLETIRKYLLKEDL